MGASNAVRGLSGDELQSIRDAVAAGRKPKVMFTQAAGQIAGQLGQVVALDDPDQSDEWLVVRFGRDELPFAPSDLAIPPRKPSRSKKHPASSTPEPTLEPARKIVHDPPPVRREETNVTTRETSKTGTTSKRARSDTPKPSSEVTRAPKPSRRAGKSARSKSPALAVTLTYQNGQWSVGATQANKSIVKAQEIKPAEALKFVGMIDIPEVRKAVEEILAAERAEAQQQAEKLRAELAEIEARLAELDETT